MKKILIGLVSFLIVVFIIFYLTSRPTATEDDAFIPSPFALKLATSSTTDFDNTKYEKKKHDHGKWQKIFNRKSSC